LSKVPLADSIRAAHALVRGLETVVFVGDTWDRLTIYRIRKEEIPACRSHEPSFRRKERFWAENRTGGGAMFHLFF
jgi:hypothetical protein